MASFSQGDKVEALVKISGGFFSQDVLGLPANRGHVPLTRLCPRLRLQIVCVRG